MTDEIIWEGLDTVIACGLSQPLPELTRKTPKGEPRHVWFSLQALPFA